MALRRLSVSGETLRGLGWVGVSSYSNFAIQFVSGIVLARLVSPTTFGLFALGLVVQTIVVKIYESGIDEAVMYLRASEDELFAANRWCATILGACVGAVGLLVAGILALLGEGDVALAAAIMVTCAGITGSGRCYQTALRRKQLWKKTAAATVPASLLSAAGAITLAASGYPLVGLAASIGLNHLITPFFCRIAWGKPIRYAGARKLAPELWRYGPAHRWIGSSLLFGAVYQCDNLAVGTLRGPAALGFYSKAYGFALLPATQATSLITAYLEPRYAAIHERVDDLRRLYVKSFRALSLVSGSLTVLAFVGAEVIVTVLLGPRWAPTVPIFRALFLHALLRPFFDDAIKFLSVVGRPKTAVRTNAAMGITVAPLAFAAAWAGGAEAVALLVGGAFLVATVYLMREVDDALTLKLTRALAVSVLWVSAGCLAGLGAIQGLDGVAESVAAALAALVTIAGLLVLDRRWRTPGPQPAEVAL